MPGRLVIAEDFEPTQYILRRLLQPHFDIVAVVSDGRALLDAVKEFHPDLVLLDISMPVINGMAVAKDLKETQPDVKILFVSAHSDQVYREEAFKLGADGYLLKNLLERELMTAVECILSGGTYRLFKC